MVVFIANKNNDNYKKHAHTAINLSYVLFGPVIIVLLCLFMVSAVKNRLSNIEPDIDNIYETTDVDVNVENIISEAIINSDISVEENTEPSMDYSKLTVDEIIGKDNEEVSEEEMSFIEKDMAIKYKTGKYEGMTADGALVLNVDGEKKFIYMIGVNMTDSDSMYYYLEDIEEVYIEYDVQNKRGNGEQAYLWLKTPKSENKEYMLNVIALRNGWGEYIDTLPNMKYTYYFLDI